MTTQSPEREGKYKIGQKVLFNNLVYTITKSFPNLEAYNIERTDFCYYCGVRESELQPLAEEKPKDTWPVDAFKEGLGEYGEYLKSQTSRPHVVQHLEKDTAPDEWEVTYIGNHYIPLQLEITRLIETNKEHIYIVPFLTALYKHKVETVEFIRTLLQARDERAGKEERERVVEIVKKCYLRRPRITGNCLGLGGIDDMSDSAIKDHNKVVDYVLKAIRKTESVPDHEGEGRGE